MPPFVWGNRFGLFFFFFNLHKQQANAASYRQWLGFWERAVVSPLSIMTSGNFSTESWFGMAKSPKRTPLRPALSRLPTGKCLKSFLSAFASFAAQCCFIKVHACDCAAQHPAEILAVLLWGRFVVLLSALLYHCIVLPIQICHLFYLYSPFLWLKGENQQLYCHRQACIGL